jgi:hypothetical protein
VGRWARALRGRIHPLQALAGSRVEPRNGLFAAEEFDRLEEPRRDV